MRDLPEITATTAREQHPLQSTHPTWLSLHVVLSLAISLPAYFKLLSRNHNSLMISFPISNGCSSYSNVIQFLTRRKKNHMREVVILKTNFPKMMHAILCKTENTFTNIPFLYWLKYLSSDSVSLSIWVASRLMPPFSEWLWQQEGRERV